MLKIDLAQMQVGETKKLTVNTNPFIHTNNAYIALVASMLTDDKDVAIMRLHCDPDGAIKISLKKEQKETIAKVYCYPIVGCTYATFTRVA